MTIDAAPADPMISLSGIHKSYGSVQSVRGVDLQVARGGVLFIIGPSGCGKSTLLRCINLLETPSAGTVQVGDDRFAFGAGHRFSERELASYRSRIGMVFQHYELFPHMTVLQNVMEGPVTVRKVRRAEARDLARELLDKVGLSAKEEMYPAQLSGGQAQRAAIARALAMQPRVMLLDEVTSALDPELVGEVLGVIKQMAEEGTTMVVVTHEMALAEEIADQVVMMDEGRIVEQGSARQVLHEARNPRTRNFLSRFRATASSPRDAAS